MTDWFELPLTRGKVALVDKDDLALVVGYSWSACDSGKGMFYARARIPGSPPRWERLHRFLMGLTPGDRRRVDHVNGNTLDYRRSNLRIVTASQNNENRTRAGSNSKTGLVGVESHRSGKFVARIKRSGVRCYLGLFPTAEAARTAYLEAAYALS